MNYSVILRTLGNMVLFEALFLTVPLVTAAIYWEAAFWMYLITIAICIAVGALCLLIKSKDKNVYSKEAFVIVALGWIVMSLFGALPFVMTQEIPSYVDALFETVSGFTTTGASILNGSQIESMSKANLMWRSFTHWLGGMGVLVFIMAFLPLSGAKNMNIMKAESPGPQVSKIVPRVRQTARILYIIYTTLTVVELVLLLVGGMPLFDAITTSFATAGTGGFAVKSDSLTSYSPYLKWVVTIFMLMFSINFNSYFLLTKRKWKEALNAEVRAFIIIVFVAIGIIIANLCFSGGYTFAQAVGQAPFTVASIISTTGFVVNDFNLWPTLSKTVLVWLMFIGACAGSTGGGIKVSRWLMYIRSTTNEIGHIIHPKQVKKITLDKKVVEHDVVRSLNAFFVAFFVIFGLSVLAVSIEGYDFTTNFTAVAATINNVGPGLNLVGPAGNFGFFSAPTKLVLIFDMLAGRLEVFPMLVLFSPKTWKK